MWGLGFVISVIAAAALIAVGVLALFFPELLARGYGIAADDAAARAYVRATGSRDTALGALFACSCYFHDGRALFVLCIAGLAISLADLAIAFDAANRKFRVEHMAHASGAIAFAIAIESIARAGGT
ncbi:MAG: DUF4267 domain-containing protein [Candidatus Eremiobacteraeota bacterium]|nr:DUF4267 domain-containing protein [Candidatus Eremiobacteraeota bacterium]